MILLNIVGVLSRGPRILMSHFLLLIRKRFLMVKRYFNIYVVKWKITYVSNGSFVFSSILRNLLTIRKHDNNVNTVKINQFVNTVMYDNVCNSSVFIMYTQILTRATARICRQLIIPRTPISRIITDSPRSDPGSVKWAFHISFYRLRYFWHFHP